MDLQIIVHVGIQTTSPTGVRSGDFRGVNNASQVCRRIHHARRGPTAGAHIEDALAWECLRRGGEAHLRWAWHCRRPAQRGNCIFPFGPGFVTSVEPTQQCQRTQSDLRDIPSRIKTTLAEIFLTCARP